MGPPGAGKGTQAGRLAARLEVPAISTGDIFRMNVASGTGLGQAARRFMDAGEYVPDDLTNAMVRDRLAAEDASDGFLLDGYPRTIAQVGELDAMLAESGHTVDVVVELVVDVEELVARLSQRSNEQGRSDDTEDVVRRRMQVYAEQTAPLVEVYSGRGLLRRVDGMGTLDEVTDRLLAAVASLHA